MASDEVNDEVPIDDKNEPNFRYADLVFKNAADKGTYKKFQKLSAAYKHSHTNWNKKGLKALTNQANNPLMMAFYE